MGVKEMLVTKVPREVAGSRTSKQYDYQKDLSLLLLIQHHPKHEDYVFLFDYHDDLLIVNSSTDPTTIDFYQIKSKETGKWGIAQLIYKKNNTDLSLLGKLYLNRILFDDYTKSINFISNAPFGFKSEKNEDLTEESTIEIKHLAKTDVTKIIAAIKADHALAEDPKVETLLKFHKTKLILEDSATHCTGYLAQFLNKLSSTNQVNADLAYKQIFNEIRIKTSAIITHNEGTNWETILEKKGITRAGFEKILEQAGLYKSFEQKWDIIEKALQSENIGFLEIRKLKSAWRTVNGTILSEPNNIPLNDLTQYIQSVINTCKSESQATNMNLSNLLNYVISKCESPPTKIFDDDFIKGLTLRQLNEE